MFVLWIHCYKLMPFDPIFLWKLEMDENLIIHCTGWLLLHLLLQQKFIVRQSYYQL